MAVDWLKIKKEYISNPTVSLVQVAEKYGVNPSYCKFVASRDKWVEQRQETQLKIDQKLTDKIPESIANIRARQAMYGRLLQKSAMKALVGDEKKGIKPIIPTEYDEITRAINVGIAIERKALAMDEKQIQDEVYLKFQQFSFIFRLNPDELQRFIQTALSHGSRQIGESGAPAPSDDGENRTGEDLESGEVPG